ncbi:MAG TPA: hypothetical protein VM939_03350 [Gemmatimonadaceae bacterium]|nr:hypothetical protein [Gemmatimonadaceae bacterium]
MMAAIRKMRTSAGCALAICLVTPALAQSQSGAAANTSRDSVTVRASDAFEAGGFRRSMLGDNYRDLWGRQIKVPVLDLARFAGGLKPTKRGGGKQTVSLRFVAPDSAEYVFRPVMKDALTMPKHFEGSIIETIVMDARSAAHPAAPVAAPAFLAAAGVLHPTPRLYVMPDDARLGEFRKEFANVLGTLEEYPAKPQQGVAFAGASRIIDSEELLPMIYADPTQRVNARALLTARLVDLLVGDNDRHPGQWKWAQLTPSGEWIPVSRDRDKMFISYGGTVMKFGRRVMPSLVKFDSLYSPSEGLFENAIEFDRRMLSGLDRSVWDSVSTALTATLSDAVIESSLRAMPAEYSSSFPEMGGKLRARRNGLQQAARDYYAFLFSVADLHGTDADDRAMITRALDGGLHVRLESANGGTYFSRRFDPAETSEVRVYLHDGNDYAVVVGAPTESIKVRVIGGNGTNTLIDSSSVAGKGNRARLYDIGVVQGINEKQDSASKAKSDDNPAYLPFNRRPWVNAYGTTIPASRDYGSTMGPTFGLSTGHGLGLVPRIGFVRYGYGFRKVPYSTMMRAEAAYSTAVRGFRVVAAADKRFESSALHVPVTASMSQLEVVEFRGFGNNIAELTGEFYDVRQRQWSFRPAIGLALGPESGISLGPIVRFTTTDSTANRFISAERPYGFGDFGQVGVQLKGYYDTRFSQGYRRDESAPPFSSPDDPLVWGLVEFSGSMYPSTWDATESYRDLSGHAATFITMPFLTRPVIALRGGGKKLFGDFPYFDAAFIGGSGSLRTEHRQRYAGDASLFGSAELRVPIAKFAFILPLDVGALGFIDMARVYVDGESPGGWHRGTGVGGWIGLVNAATNVNVVTTNHPDRKIQVSMGFAF